MGETAEPTTESSPPADSAEPTGEGASRPDESTAGAAPSEPPLPFVQGDTAEGHVIKIDGEGALVDLGTWIEGYISGRELTRVPHTPLDTVVCIGERVKGLVTTTRGPDGRPRLSPLRLESEAAWVDIEKILAGDGILTARVVEAVKGGLRLDAGVEAFLPASLIDVHPVSNLAPYVGQELRAKIIETDKRRYKVVLSRRAILEAERKEKRAEIFANLTEGELATGKVSSVTDIGAFVDLGGADGLVHITELSWTRVSHPKDVVAPGEEVEVKVLKLEPERDRISLSLRQAREHPWEDFVRAHRVGEVVTGKVTKAVDFGAFVEVAEGVEGLVHISEIAPFRVEKAADHVAPGQEVQVRLLDIDVARRRLSLSIRAVEEPEAQRRPAQGRGKGRSRGGGRRGGRTYSAGEDVGSGLGAAISSDSLDALSALKEQLEEPGEEPGEGPGES